MDKSPEAFRTISEVAETLETPAHVLRFWESRFPQIRPVKRAGGRRYYRPADVALLTGIKRLLHDEGLTIRGVQKILREQGVRHVAGLAGAPDANAVSFDPAAALEEAMTERFGSKPAVPVPAAEVAEVETAQIFALETALRRTTPGPLPKTADLFDLMADPAATGAVVLQPDPDAPPAPTPVDAAEPQADLTTSDDTDLTDDVALTENPEPTEGAQTGNVVGPGSPDVSRAALLRALPTPLPDDLRAALLPLRVRMAQHRDRLVEVARSGSYRA